MSVAVVEDSTLESMTTSLCGCRVSSSSSRTSCRRCTTACKRSSRQALIQDALTAAQQHQDAVLNVIQNYESLSVAAEAASASSAGPRASPPTSDLLHAGSRSSPPADSRLSTSSDYDRSSSASMGGGGAGLPPRHSRQSVRMVHLPPVANELQVFKMLPRAKPSAEGGGEEEEEEDEGIRYVDNVQVVGGVLGTVLKASGDFVGQPTMQWYWHRNPNPDPDPNLKESRRRSGTSPTRRRALEASGALARA